MPKTTTRSVKLMVPAETTRDHLLVFARRMITQTVRLTQFEIKSMTISHSKCEKPGQVTYMIEFTNLLPN